MVLLSGVMLAVVAATAVYLQVGDEPVAQINRELAREAGWPPGVPPVLHRLRWTLVGALALGALALPSAVAALWRKPLGRLGLEIVSWAAMVWLLVPGSIVVGFSFRLLIGAVGLVFGSFSQTGDPGRLVEVPIGLLLGVLAIAMMAGFLGLLCLLGLSVRGLRKPEVQRWFRTEACG